VLYLAQLALGLVFTTGLPWIPDYNLFSFETTRMISRFPDFNDDDDELEY